MATESHREDLVSGTGMCGQDAGAYGRIYMAADRNPALSRVFHQLCLGYEEFFRQAVRECSRHDDDQIVRDRFRFVAPVLPVASASSSLWSVAVVYSGSGLSMFARALLVGAKHEPKQAAVCRLLA